MYWNIHIGSPTSLWWHPFPGPWYKSVRCTFSISFSCRYSVAYPYMESTEIYWFFIGFNNVFDYISGAPTLLRLCRIGCWLHAKFFTHTNIGSTDTSSFRLTYSCDTCMDESQINICSYQLSIHIADRFILMCTSSGSSHLSPQTQNIQHYYCAVHVRSK